MAKTMSDPALTSLAHLLHRACQYADDSFTRAIGDDDLTTRQLVVLRIVSESDRPSQVDICAKSGIDRSTLADMVRRLIGKGYISRRRTREDARRYALRLTESGEKVLESALPKLRESEQAIVAKLTQQQRQMLHELLVALIESQDDAERQTRAA